jgi:hypothetical protein
VQPGQHLGHAFEIAAQSPEARQPGKAALNGLVTNDKFCLTRFAFLKLASSRYEVWRQRASHPSEDPPAKLGFCGGQDETPVDYSPADDCTAGRPTALGSGVPDGVGVEQPMPADSRTLFTSKGGA